MRYFHIYSTRARAIVKNVPNLPIVVVNFLFVALTSSLSSSLLPLSNAQSNSDFFLSNRTLNIYSPSNTEYDYTQAYGASAEDDSRNYAAYSYYGNGDDDDGVAYAAGNRLKSPRNVNANYCKDDKTEFCTDGIFTWHRSKVKNIYVGGIFPMIGGWPGGQCGLPSAIMALNDVNLNASILPNYRINLNWFNSEVNELF